MADLKPVYRAVSKDAAETALDELENGVQQYRWCSSRGDANGRICPAYFRYPANIRKVIYTTNAIESVHRQFRS